MSALLFLIGYLSIAVVLGVVGGKAARRWAVAAAVLGSASLPGLLWLAFSIRDAIMFDRPVFDLVSESGRFGFYVGGHLALWATPVWLLAALGGVWIGRRRRIVVT